MTRPTSRSNHGTGGPGRQRGAVAVMAGVLIFALLLMVGLVIDLGHLYVAKSELQNAADACALSGARELNDLSAGAADRITAAAVKAGSFNKVDLQKDDAEILDADVTFSESLSSGTWTRVITQNTKYVRCNPHGTNPKSILLSFMRFGAALGEGGTRHVDMTAEAVGARVGGQSMCALPIAICTTATATSTVPDWGFVTGTWYSGRLAAGTGVMGNYGWIRFEGQGARPLGEILAGSGMCDVGPERVDAEPGVTHGAAQAWNTRFGLYSGPWNDIDRYPPDRTGYAYTPDRVDSHGVTIPGSWPAAAPEDAYTDYGPRKNVTHDPYNPTSLLGSNGRPVALPGNPSPLSFELHGAKGQDRRTVYVPVIRCADWQPNGRNMPVRDYACAFMLGPVDDPNADVRLEYRGLKSKGGGPCGTSGVPGDLGPPVPALVR